VTLCGLSFGEPVRISDIERIHEKRQQFEPVMGSATVTVVVVEASSSNIW
jgi:hypothetical protein